ncbi:glycoside hydrolase domain-containing protein [Streptomyces sp. NPDC059740]|uniref:glycoside hydrolase domain-containing protein n=1 Tax=Streptomyces sp. NPDC059740 TaxID=3346926 RepID=UPI00364726E2
MRSTKQIIRRGLLLFTALSSLAVGADSAGATDPAAADAHSARGTAGRPETAGASHRAAPTGPARQRPAAPGSARPIPTRAPSATGKPKPPPGDGLPPIPPSPSSHPPLPTGEPRPAKPHTKPGGSPSPTAGNAPAGGHAASRSSRAAKPRIFEGRALDTCLTPPLTTLDAWRDSPYRGIGVYFGGRGRACPDQPRLDRDWVRGADRRGWRVLPVYVGSQAPCISDHAKQQVRLGEDPEGQGVREGRDAVARARELGMAPTSPLYLDMEAYDIHDADCSATTMTFVRAWSRTVRAWGYLAGFYSSADSGVAQLAAAHRAKATDLPQAVWFARWHVPPALYEERALPDKAWRPHRRIHQYEGNVDEEYGGVRMHIDRNQVDAPVAILAR